MVFLLEDELFKDKNREDLLLMLYSAVSNFAYLDFDIDSPVVASWIENNGGQDWRVVHENFIQDVATFKLSNRAKVVESLNTSNWTLPLPEVTLFEAKNLITMPFEIWVENGINDGEFIELVLSPICSALLKKLIEHSRVNFKTLGGIGEIKKNVLKYTTTRGFRHKRFVFCDSDAPKKGAIQPDAQKIINTCELNKTPYHCLERRSIENYFPIDYLIDEIHPNVRGRSHSFIKYNAFKKLTEEQRHHYHMKVGVMNKPLCDSGLYDDVMNNILSEGDLWEGFSEKYANKYLSKKNDWNKIRRMMLEQDSANELAKIETKLIDLIRLPV
ncbi:hypothetical protein AB3D24_002184 [Vibrio alginolyticus]